MNLVSVSARRGLRVLPLAPLSRSVSIPPGRPRAPPYYAPPPPARRRFEYALPTPAPESGSASKSQSRPAHPRAQVERRPTNRQIPFDRVYVVDPETGKLSRTKRPLEELLQTIQGQGQRGRVVELVASTPEPVVRITTRSEVEARYREMKKALKKGAKVGEEPKEVQLTWGVAKADLEHKLRKAGRDLEKGYRVLVAVTVKRGHRPSSRQELVAFGDEISRTLSEVGEEWKEREVSDRSMMLSFRKTESGDGNS